VYHRPDIRLLCQGAQGLADRGSHDDRGNPTNCPERVVSSGWLRVGQKWHLVDACSSLPGHVVASPRPTEKGASDHLRCNILTCQPCGHHPGGSRPSISTPPVPASVTRWVRTRLLRRYCRSAARLRVAFTPRRPRTRARAVPAPARSEDRLRALLGVPVLVAVHEAMRTR